MKKVYIKKKRINEDDVPQDNTQTQQTASQANPTNNADSRTPEQKRQIIDQLTQQIASIQMQVNSEKKKVTDAQNAYSKYLEKVRNTVAKYNAEISALGGNPVPISESVSFIPLYDMRFKKKLFEAKTPVSQVEEIEALLRIAFERVPDNSYVPGHNILHTYARNIKTYITNSGWDKEISPKNHWDSLEKFIRTKFESGTKISNSKRELDAVLSNTKDLFKKSSTFSWIFGNEKNN